VPRQQRAPRPSGCYDPPVIRYFPTYPRCPVCGDPAESPGALGVRWEWHAESSEVRGAFTAAEGHAGYAGRVHGGLLSALLDECLAWACAMRARTFCATGELAVRFKGPAPLGRSLRICGRTEADWGPYIRAVGEIRTPEGELVVTATATFAAMPRAEAERLRASLRFQPGDIDVLAQRPPGPGVS
jgi:acyl-coenzyme A thioesterase PaaI-like protein